VRKLIITKTRLLAVALLVVVQVLTTTADAQPGRRTPPVSETVETGNGLAKTMTPPVGPPCPPGAAALCLNGSRFRVEVVWRVPSQGKSGIGNAVGVTTDTGYFWFFSSNNVELVIKVVDGRAANGRFWVFYGALSDVEYTITVADTATGAVKTYFNPSGQIASVGDTYAFPGVPAPLAEPSTQASSPTEGAQGPAVALALLSERRSARWQQEPACMSGPTTLCLNDGRFQVQAAWRVPSQGTTGRGTAVALTGDTGGFWFFSSNNIEVVLKVVDGRALNDAFWVFFGALSDVQYTITVTDMQAGAVKTYWNAPGQLASVADTTAFGPAPSQPVWRRLAAGPGGNPVAALAVDPLNGGSLYAGTSFGLFKLIIGESNDWMPLSLPSPPIRPVVIAPTDPLSIYAIILGDPGPIRGLRDTVLMRSRDAGKTWSAMLPGIYSIAIDPSRPTTVYAGASPTFSFYATGVSKSNDGGDHWGASSGDFPCEVLATSLDPATVYAAGLGRIYKSTDGGVTWSAVHAGDFIYAMAVDPVSPSTTYAGSAIGTYPSPHGVLRTADAGATWSFFPVPEYSFGPVVVDPSSRAVFLGTEGGVLRSDDEGEHWTPFNDGLTGFSVSSLVLGPRQTLYAGTRDGVFAVSLLPLISSQSPPARTVPLRLIREAQD
jgi:hypothetical protein